MCIGGGLREVTLSPTVPGDAPSCSRTPPAEPAAPLSQCVPTGHPAAWILTIPTEPAESSQVLLWEIW